MGTGVGEAMLISAAVGAGTGAAGSAISGGDPLKGALTGAALGAVGGGISSIPGALTSTGANIAGTATESALNAQIANEALIGSAVPAGAPVVPGFGVIPPDAGLTAIAPPPTPVTGNEFAGLTSEGIASLNNTALQKPVSIPPAFKS